MFILDVSELQRWKSRLQFGSGLIDPVRFRLTEVYKYNGIFKRKLEGSYL